MESETFYFDDYFADEDDKGVEVLIPWRGKMLPFRIRRALTLAERQRANNAAIKIDISKDGKPALIGEPNQAAYTAEILLVGLKHWPFEYSPGKPVPINAKTIAKLDGGLADQIASRILGITALVDEAVLDPFAQKSEED